MTSFIGRAREVTEVGRLLRQSDLRLLTLTGPPGIGKTRLAIHAAASVGPRFPDGVWFVNLAPVSDPELVAQAIATALGVRQLGSGSLHDSLEQFLSQKVMLLLLDNFEQLLLAGPYILLLLKGAPGLKALITSRELLRLSGERAFVVPPLSLPPVPVAASDLILLGPSSTEELAGYEAVRLFIERASALKSDFVFDMHSSQAVTEICCKLDGLPLAIELAAARVRHLSPEAILQRLQHRFQLLTGGPHDLPDRQRALSATLEWSYALLDSEDARLFRRLAVFRGGYSLEAVEAVCNIDQDMTIDPLAGVSSLADKSLLYQVQGSGSGGDPRYVFLETIHEFALEKLQQSEEEQVLRRRHAAYFTKLAECTQPRLKGPDQVEWLQKLGAEQDNFRAALDWSYDRDVALGMRLVAALGTFWSRRGNLHEGHERATAILEKARKEGVARTSAMAHALYTAGFIAFRQGNLLLARSDLDESVEIFRSLARGNSADRSGLAEALNLLGIVASRLQDIPSRRRLHEEALATAREAADAWGVARSLYQLGHTARLGGDYETARLRFEESLTIFREHGDHFNIALALVGLGQIAERLGELCLAEDLFNQSLTIFREIGDLWGISGLLYSLACVAQKSKDYARARALHEENLSSFKALGLKIDLAETLRKLGRLAHFEGDYERAHHLYREGLGLFKELGDKIGVALCLMDAAGTVVVAMGGSSAGRRQGTQSAAAPRGYSANRRAIVTQSARLMSAADSLFASLGFQPEHEDQEMFKAYIRAARKSLSGRAFSTAWTSGQILSIEDAFALALSIQPPLSIPRRPPSAKGIFGLTRREREIAALVAQGKSNRDIATLLVITERTVEGHISSMLAKLGFRSRAQISVWAVENSLTRTTL